MSQEIIISPSKFGIAENKANELVGNLPEIKKERDALTEGFNKVINMDIEDLKTSDEAKKVRMAIQKNRTKGINVWHRTTKDFFLKGGQFVDAVKRKEMAINERMEEKLLEIENYQAIKEEKRISYIRHKREVLAAPFFEFIQSGIDFGRISEDDFNKVLTGARLQKIEADKRAEAERLEQEKKERLKAEAEQKALKERKELELKLQKERIEREKIEKELEKVRIEEQKKESERLAEIERKRLAEAEAAKAPAKEQLKKWVNSFSIAETSIDNEVAIDISRKFENFKKWALNQIKNI